MTANGAAIAPDLRPMSAPGCLLCVGPDEIAAVWPMVAGMIDAAYAAMDRETPDVRTWLMQRKGLLWVYAVGAVVVAAATTSLEPRLGGLVCRVVTAGGFGGLNLWKECISQIEHYARAEGCYKVLFDGRPGWGRVLPGYEPVCVSFERRI